MAGLLQVGFTPAAAGHEGLFAVIAGAAHGYCGVQPLCFQCVSVTLAENAQLLPRPHSVAQPA